MSKVKAGILCLLVIILCFLVPSKSSGDQTAYVHHLVPLYSSVSMDAAVSTYTSGDSVFITIEDAARLTRCDISRQEGLYVLTHAKGIRTILFHDPDNTVTENGEKQSLQMETVQGRLLVEAYPVLTYLGAVCKSSENLLVVGMPTQTFWETYAHASPQWMDVKSYDDVTKTTAIVCDLIVDFFSPISGQSPLSILGTGLDETKAVYAAMETEPNDYPLVKAAIQARTQSFNDVTTAFSRLYAFQKNSFDHLFLMDDLDRKLTHEMIFSYRNRKHQNAAYREFKTIFDKRDAFRKDYKGALAAADLALVGADAFLTTYDRLQIDSTARDALSGTFSQETINKAGKPRLDDNYVTAARHVSKTLRDVPNTVLRTVYEKVSDKVGGFVLDKGLSAALTAFGTASGPALLSVEVAGLVMETIPSLPGGEYTPFVMIPAAEADLMAISSADFYRQSFQIMEGLHEKALAEKYHDLSTLQKLHGAYLMALRASLVHHESLIRFQESSKFFLETNLGPLKARAGEIAAVIDQLNHCPVTEIPLLSTLTNATRAFNEPFSTLPAGQAPAPVMASASNEVMLPDMRDPFIFASGAGAWRTMVTIHPDGTLEGAYLDADAGDAGNEYPNGTRWECHFTGKFQAIEKVGEFEFAMTLEHLQYEEEPDAERIVDGVRIIATEPYGLEGTGQFRLYLPGMPTSALSDEFLTWYGNIKGWADVPDVLPDYGLYNVSELYGFSPLRK